MGDHWNLTTFVSFQVSFMLTYYTTVVRQGKEKCVRFLLCNLSSILKYINDMHYILFISLYEISYRNLIYVNYTGFCIISPNSSHFSEVQKFMTSMNLVILYRTWKNLHLLNEEYIFSFSLTKIPPWLQRSIQTQK